MTLKYNLILLVDIAKDSAIHQQHGYLTELHTKRINRMKFSQSRELGYSTPNASPTRVSQHGSSVGSDHLHPSRSGTPYGSRSPALYRSPSPSGSRSRSLSP